MTIDIPSLIMMAGGELVGKIRLQKVVYLLDQLGLQSGFTYEYHHYGPYSEDLAERVEDDIIFGKLEAVSQRRQRDGVPYTVYHATAPGDGEPVEERLPTDRLKFALDEMQRRSATVLELAATAHWLANTECVENWEQELISRKGAKTLDGRDREAFELLRILHLLPTSQGNTLRGS